MSKFGVGVGEEFPVDEQNRPNDTPNETDADSAFCGRGSREDRREAWRQFRREMHGRWHRHGGRGDHGDPEDLIEHLRSHHLHHLVIGALAVIGLAALISHHRD